MNILYTASCGHRSVASIDAGSSRRFHRRLEWCKSVNCKACYLLEIGKRDEAREAALLACEPTHPAFQSSLWMTLTENERA
jgi:hypothetical protein